MYMAFKNRGEEEVWGPSVFICMCIGGLFSPIWNGGLELIYASEPPTKSVYIVCIITLVILHFWYKKRREKIIQRYKDSTYNKRIHVFFIYMMIPVLGTIGLFFGALMDKYIIDPYHLRGILGKWLGIM